MNPNQEQFDQMRLRVDAAKSRSKLVSNQSPAGEVAVPTASTAQVPRQPSISQSKRIRQDKKPNKLESDWLSVLKVRLPTVNWRYEHIRLRLNGGGFYVPDFTGHVVCKIVIYECKGRHRFREKGIYKFRLAAEQYPEFEFILVERGTAGWKETRYGNI
jgi:hypothetical protein